MDAVYVNILKTVCAYQQWTSFWVATFRTDLLRKIVTPLNRTVTNFCVAAEQSCMWVYSFFIHNFYPSFILHNKMSYFLQECIYILLSLFTTWIFIKYFCLSLFIYVCLYIFSYFSIFYSSSCILSRHKRLFNPPPEFSRLQGTWCPSFNVSACLLVFVFYSRIWVMDWFLFFLFHSYIHWLVCYTHTFHGCNATGWWEGACEPNSELM